MFILKESNMKKVTPLLLYFVSCLLISNACSFDEEETRVAGQWSEVELTFESAIEYNNSYTDVDFWVRFIHSSGDTLLRPGFWDGDSLWKICFSSPADNGEWYWESFCSNEADLGLKGKKGRILCKEGSGDKFWQTHGLLKMSEGKRSVIHADGTPFLMIGDTPWALPWRGTFESVAEYAVNREERGFNAALLMSLQPDQHAEGPRNRTVEGGFDVAFEDLDEGHITQINMGYFRHLDSLVHILLDHGIVPVYQPVFHGFGWKGLEVLGKTVDSAEYARYTRFLIARYGAQPAMWLVGADGCGKDSGVEAGGVEAEKWDAYEQPTGIHYNPFDESCSEWVPQSVCFHQNKSFQDADWLDFQWCQTGHTARQLLHKVEKMYENLPVKAVANGEPTYEGIWKKDNGSGWWQGNEAWSQFLSGGSMGVVYGAGGLWNWKLTATEEGWPDWADSNASWRDAINVPGAVYVGYVGKALDGINTTDLEKHPELAGGNLCMARPGEVYIVYLPEGGRVSVSQLTDELCYKWFDPMAGEFMEGGDVKSETQEFLSAGSSPMVLIIS